jgi:hypothetical protein
MILEIAENALICRWPYAVRRAAVSLCATSSEAGTRACRRAESVRDVSTAVGACASPAGRPAVEGVGVLAVAAGRVRQHLPMSGRHPARGGG